MNNSATFKSPLQAQRKAGAGSFGMITDSAYRVVGALCVAAVGACAGSASPPSSTTVSAGTHAPSGVAGMTASATSGSTGGAGRTGSSGSSSVVTPIGTAGTPATGSAGSAVAGSNSAGPGGAAAASGAGGKSGAGGRSATGSGGSAAGSGGAAGGTASGSSLTGTLGALGAVKPVLAGWATTNGPETLIYLSSSQLTCAMMMTMGTKWLATLPAGTQVIEIVIPGTAKVGTVSGFPAGEVNYAEGSKTSATEVTGTGVSIMVTKAETKGVIEGMIKATYAMGSVMGTFHAEWCQGGGEY